MVDRSMWFEISTQRLLRQIFGTMKRTTVPSVRIIHVYIIETSFKRESTFVRRIEDQERNTHRHPRYVPLQNPLHFLWYSPGNATFIRRALLSISVLVVKIISHRCPLYKILDQTTKWGPALKTLDTLINAIDDTLLRWVTLWALKYSYINARQKEHKII